MRLGVSLIDSMFASLLNFTAVNDPDIVFDLENVTMIIIKKTANNINNETVVTKHGTLDLPEITSVIGVEPEGCVEQTMFFASFNPQMWVESAAGVNSHTLRFSLDTCDVDNVTETSGDARRRRRRRRSIGDDAGLRHILFSDIRHNKSKFRLSLIGSEK